jgi:hypothetical protein
MAKKAKKSARGRAQDRARVAGGQGYEVRYESKKDRKSAGREEGGQESWQQPKESTQSVIRLNHLRRAGGVC